MKKFLRRGNINVSFVASLWNIYRSISSQMLRLVFVRSVFPGLPPAPKKPMKIFGATWESNTNKKRNTTCVPFFLVFFVIRRHSSPSVFVHRHSSSFVFVCRHSSPSVVIRRRHSELDSESTSVRITYNLKPKTHYLFGLGLWKMRA